MKIIVTVGTSLITNKSGRKEWMELDDNSFSLDLFTEGSTFYQEDIKQKEDALEKDLLQKNACAEIASIQKIDPDGKAEIYLICTETVTSFMCGRVLQKYLNNRYC